MQSRETLERDHLYYRKKTVKSIILEALWTFPLFIICPLIGLILVLIGIIKIRNGNSRKTLLTGLAFLAIPLIFLGLTVIFQIGLENKIKGKYSIESEKGVLVIKEDRTFILRNSNRYNNSGDGTWELEEIDFPILKLDFDKKGKRELWLQINNYQNPISLSTMSWGNNISIEFVKE